MALIMKRKSGIVFSVPSINSKVGNSKENKIEKIIEEAILEKIFNSLNINRKIYLKLIQYFMTYTLDEKSGIKSISSFNLRLKTKADKKFISIPSNEIEIAGIKIKEFENFLIENSAKEYKNINDILDKI